MSDVLLLDTSAVIPHLRRDESVTEKLKNVDSLYLPVVALGELFHGAYRLPFPSHQIEKLRLFLQAVVVLGVGTTTAEHFGRISAKLTESGSRIPTNDIWVAALALEHGLPLAARDAHFSRVDGLTLVEW